MQTVARYLPNATAQFTETITDATGAVVVDTDIATATITLKRGATVINSRNAQDALNANDVTIDSSGLLTWSVQVADVSSTTRVEHRADFLITTNAGEVIAITHRMYISPTIALTTFEDVEVLLDGISSDDRLLIEQLSDALTDRVERHTGRSFAYNGAVVEVFSPGRQRSELALGTFPLISVTSVHESTDGVFGASALLDADDYFVNTTEGRIELRAGARFIGGPGSVQVTYEAGYRDIGFVPMDIRMACTQQVAYAYQRRSSGGITSENVNGMSVTRFVEDLLPQLVQVLNRYQTTVVI
jgi:hypothetical protein